jgi:coenzyme F420-0:L-glutamate ligase/coenzyme F420-1:gamma-L-glutamate ligase
MSGDVLVSPVVGLGEILPGDDLGAAIVDACTACGIALADDDILAVASKVVAKAEGRLVAAAGREDLVDDQTAALVAHRRTPRGRTVIGRSASGPVLAAAGVDASNVPPGYVLLLPADPDASAQRLRARLGSLTGLRLGVVITDTLGRPWREGQTDAALGAAGVQVLDDHRGRTDAAGRPLEVTVRAVADEVAAAADLVKQKVKGIPVAVLRGLGPLPDEDGPGAGVLVRHGDDDWFRWGSLESVENALGHMPGGVPPAPAGRIPWREAVARSLALAEDPGGRHEGATVDARPVPSIAASDTEVTVVCPPGATTTSAIHVERLLTALAAHGHPCTAWWEPDRVVIRATAG